MKHILKCTVCAKYTLNEKCTCGGLAAMPKPAKFSPEDNYGGYRRKAKQETFKERDLL